MVVDQIQLGQPLPFGVRDEHGKLLLAKGSVVATEGQLQTLRERGLYADHDDPEAATSATAAARRLTLFDMWKQTTARLDLLLGSLAQPGFAARCDGFAGQLMALTDRDPDIGIYLSMRQDPNRLSLYGLSHALHCALVGQLAARRAGWPDTRVRTLVKAALTMNLSIVEVQGRFATMGRLNDTQRAQIRAHPRGTLLMWSALLGWQLRLRVTLAPMDDGLEVSSRWTRLKLSPAAHDYLSPMAPGTPLGQPSQERGSRAYFAVVSARVTSLDWLELHADGHRRALFDDQGARWVQP